MQRAGFQRCAAFFLQTIIATLGKRVQGPKTKTERILRGRSLQNKDLWECLITRRETRCSRLHWGSRIGIIADMQQTSQKDRESDSRMETRAGGLMQYPRDQDDEIDLREYIHVAIKRKKIVLGFILVSVLSAAVLSLMTPKIYEVSMIIEPPINAITETGTQNFDSGANIKALIEAGAYNIKIINDLNLLQTGLHFNVALPKDTNLIEVGLKTTAEQSDMSKKIMAKLLEHLNLGYAKIIEDKRSRIENQIKTILNQISTKENEIKSKTEQFKIIEDRERQFVEEIKATKANSERLLAKREAVFERGENKDDTATLFYAATIQQNISYFTQLQNDLSDLKNKKEAALGAISNLKADIAANRIEIGNLSLLKDGVQNVQVVQEPNVSPRPVESNRSRNVLGAGVLGLLLGLLSVFVIEYWENSPGRS